MSTLILNGASNTFFFRFSFITDTSHLHYLALSRCCLRDLSDVIPTQLIYNREIIGPGPLGEGGGLKCVLRLEGKYARGCRQTTGSDEREGDGSTGIIPWTPWFLASWTVKEIYVILKHPIWATLSQWLWETDILHMRGSVFAEASLGLSIPRALLLPDLISHLMFPAPLRTQVWETLCFMLWKTWN